MDMNEVKEFFDKQERIFDISFVIKNIKVK